MSKIKVPARQASGFRLLSGLAGGYHLCVLT